MKLNIASKLFLTVLLVTASVIVLIIAATNWSLRHGFANYMSGAQLTRLDGLVTLLERQYAADSGWQAFERRPQAWDDLLESARGELQAQAFPPPPRPPGSRLFGRRPPPRPPGEAGPPDRPLRPPPLADRLSLRDADGRLIAGRRGAFDDGFARRPLHHADAVVGYLAVALPSHSSEVDQAFLRDSTRVLYLIGAVGLLLSVSAAFLLARHFVRPLRTIAGATHRLAAGDYAVRIEDPRQDEFGALIRDFNRLGVALGQHEESRRRWVADTSHELRTPIAVLRAQIEALQDGVHKAEPRVFEQLHGQVLRLGKLVEDLHHLARADAGALAFHRVPVEPVAIVEEMLAVFAARLEAKQIAVTLDNALDGTALVSADADRLRQLFANLLENSLRYTDAGGRIRVAFARDGRSLSIVIEDTVPGVGASAMSQLFERFFRADASRQRESGGSGLGLAICKSIVEAHDGRIEAAPSTLGGLKITIVLPLMET